MQLQKRHRKIWTNLRMQVKGIIYAPVYHYLANHSLSCVLLSTPNNTPFPLFLYNKDTSTMQNHPQSIYLQAWIYSRAEKYA